MLMNYIIFSIQLFLAASTKVNINHAKRIESSENTIRSDNIDYLGKFNVYKN